MHKTPHQGVTIHLTNKQAVQLRTILANLDISIGDVDLLAIVRKLNKAMNNCWACYMVDKGYKSTVLHTCRDYDAKL